MKFLSADMSDSVFKKARQTVLANRLYNQLAVSRDLYRNFSAHIGVVLVYGALGNQRHRQVEVQYGQNGKPFIYLTIDARNLGFFSDPRHVLPSGIVFLRPKTMFSHSFAM